MIQILTPFALMITADQAIGKDFGSMGQVFQIEEESILDFMKRNVPQQEMNQMSLEIKKILLEKAKNPLPVKGIQNAKKYRSFILDLSIKVDKDIKDKKGALIAKAGAKVNPLEKVELDSGLLFLDGNDEEQISWARQQQGNFKWILVRGKPTEVEEKENRPIYFDQGGHYTILFQIENIPAKVTQEGHFLHVEELVLQEAL